MTDYKDTLNLPHTEFPMKANLPQREPELLRQWEANDIYQKLRELQQAQEKFVLHDGPPYANGHTHIGHAVNKILKDIVVKAKTLDNLNAAFVPGWDCHGLPIELNVEKKYGKAGEKLSAEEFRAKCRTYASEQIDIQREEFKRLGIIGDWTHPYRTMDFSYEADIIRALAQIIANGHVMQGFKPVHWCIDCGSSLAEAEVEYQDKTSPAIDVRFRVVDEKEFLSRFNLTEKNAGTGPISVPIWTTTPWTLPANEAVAIHAELEYALVQITTAHGTERLLISPLLLKDSLARYGVTEQQELARINGAALENILLQHPFYDRQVPLALGTHVTTETGTGAVHIAPAHGQDDYQVGLKYKLALVNPVGTNGCFLPNTPLFAGEHVFKANPHVIEILKERDTLLSEQKLQHSYPHCWRHKTPLIFLATPQWFVSMEKANLRNTALEAINNVRWMPDWGKARLYGMIKDRPDWCISRQRAWGVPLPLFIHKETRALHPEMSRLLEEVAQRVSKIGIDAWFNLDPKEILGSDAAQYEKITDTLDVWFESGVSHFAILKKNPVLSWPADLYLEGSDQHRGWFHSSLLTANAMYGTAPYKAVLTHGFTVDEHGRKMSKSLGNVIAPEKVINSLGADILRLWVASTDYRAEITVSDEILKRTAEAYRRIRNTTRFLLANLHDFEPEKNLLPPAELLSLDRWIIERAQQLQNEIRVAYNDYQFHTIYQKLHNFCVNELGGFYLDIIKDRQYTMQKNSRGRRSAQTALYHIAQAMVRWFAPILSFTAEEIWQYLPGKKAASVFLAQWYDLPTVKTDPAHNWDSIIQVRNAVNKEIEAYRNNGDIGSALEAEVELYCQAGALKDTLLALGTELRFVLITSDARILPAQDANLAYTIKIMPIGKTKTKCARCWHRRDDVGKHAEHPEICERCIENIEGTGEHREYA